MAQNSTSRRPRGRPPKTIDREQLADVIERLFAEGGIEAVAIDRTAKELSISRATLYRTIPTKEALLGVLMERIMRRLGADAEAAATADGRTARERMHALVRVHVEAATHLPRSLFTLFGGARLPPETYEDWRRWRADYEQLWVDTIREAAADGAVRTTDPVTATRLILGMCVWVSRWFRPDQDVPAEQIADVAIALLDASPDHQEDPA